MMLYPVSTWIISPVIPLDKSLDKNNAVLETSSVVIFLLSGDFSNNINVPRFGSVSNFFHCIFNL